MADNRLDDLLSQFLQLRARGQPPTPEDLCRDCPELLEPLKNRIRGLAALDGFLGSERTPASAAERPTAVHLVQQPPTPSPAPDGPAGEPLADQPRRVGRFRVQKLLGAGGFARVYLAYDPTLDRQVAIKVLHRHCPDPDSLRREAIVAAKLKHPGIVPIYEIGPDSAAGPAFDQPVYMVMQYIEGTNLAQKLEAGKLTLDQTVELMLAVAEALAFAHSAGVLHRDLKPHNILLDVNDRPYVADFGLGIRQETMMHHVGEQCGTLAYMSPEQAEGRTLTAASDIWSLGVILYELLVRQRPFGSHPMEVLRRLGKEQAVSPRQFDSTVPQQLERICLKCLALNPADRYQAAAELIAELRQYATHREVGPDEEERLRAEQSYKQAVASIDSGQLPLAIERLQHAVRLNPDFADAYYLLGLAQLLTDHNVRLAIEPLRKALELNRDNGPANYLLAHVYYEVQAFPLAATFAEQALATAPANQTYREFQNQVRRQVASSSSGDTVPSTEPQYDLPSPRRRHLSEVAEVVFRLDRSRQLSLTHWTVLHFPWRLIRHRPALGALVLVLALYGMDVALHLPAWDTAAVLRLGVVCALMWMQLYFPFVFARLLETTYVRLLPTVNMPEDAFRRFFVRQSAYVLGGSCGLREPETQGCWRTSWQYNRPHLVLAALSFGPLLVLQCTCGNAAPWPLTWAGIALFGAALLQTYLALWITPLAALCPLFIPRFASIPVRYFLGMPAELSLAAIGTFYVRVSWLAGLGYVAFLLQHYVFRTYQTVPLFSVPYCVVGICWAVAVILVTQYQLRRLLAHLKARKILEYSYHVEAAFERVMKKPGDKTFAELRAHQDFLKNLNHLPTRGLTPEARLHFLLILTLLVGATVVYGYLVLNDHWLL
jgi:serine/threonine protein kinase